MTASRHQVTVNRAAVLTLWAAVVAERLGFDRNEALTLGRAVAGLNAQAKGRALGIFHPVPKALKEQRGEMKHGERLTVGLLGRAVPAMNTPDGLRALDKDKPSNPATVARYLTKAFGEALGDVRAAIAELAGSMAADDLASCAFRTNPGQRAIVQWHRSIHAPPLNTLSR